MEQLQLDFEKEFKVGDRVKIIGKSVGLSLSRSNTYRHGDGFGYVTYVYKNEIDLPPNTYVVYHKKTLQYSGDFFLRKDLERV